MQLSDHELTHSQRVVNDWNDLPSDVITAPSIIEFKIRLDKYWEKIHYVFVE